MEIDKEDLEQERDLEKVDYLFEINRPDQAIALIKKLLQKNPDDPMLLTRLAGGYCDMEKLKEAREIIEASLQLDPECGYSHHVYALVLEKSGDFDGADREYLVALSLEPWDSSIVLHYGL